MSYIYRAFGFMLNVIYGVVQNYGIAIILLTIIIKLLVLPLTLKQQKSMTKMQRIQPKLAELQEKYKYDKETDELFYCELESHSEYSKRDEYVCKIISPEDETTVPEEGESNESDDGEDTE